jgi:hypothetical protein
MLLSVWAIITPLLKIGCAIFPATKQNFTAMEIEIPDLSAHFVSS